MQADSSGLVSPRFSSDGRSGLAPVLSCRGFGVAFGDREIFSSVDFELEPGSISILTGPPGSGRSTLLRTLAGLSQQNSRFRCWGEATYLGRPLGDGPHPWLVRQDARLMQSSVLDALLEALRAHPSRPRGLGRECVEEELRALGVAELAGQLSSRCIELPTVLQRAMPIVAAVLRGAPLVLLDEPTLRLSGEDADRILALIGSAARTCTVLAVMQDEGQAWRIRTRRISMATRSAAAGNGTAAAPAGGAPASGGRSGDGAAPLAPAPAPVALPGSVSPVRRPPAGGGGLELVARLLDGPVPEPRGPAGFSWIVLNRLAGTAMPGDEPGLAPRLAALARAGVTRLITLTGKDLPQPLLARHALSNLHLPVREGEPPTVAQTNMLLIRMQGMLDRGEVLAVHCGDGMGRSGTVLAAWLIREGGLSAAEALARLRRIDPGFVQSTEQEEFLHLYEHSFLKN